MNNQAKPIRIHDFGADPLCGLSQWGMQKHYLCEYLTALGASKVIEEQNYFDRDYLAEYSSFYSTSTAGYPNVCRRLHFFSSPDVNRALLERAISGAENDLHVLQASYLGFVVLRPLPMTAIGRTVLTWYPENFPDAPRVTSPSRPYDCHLAGIKLTLERGLAWQQQDSAVGACATVGIWTILHSSAFDDHHAIPTTADITRSAHKTASLGARVFPSSGLMDFQVCEAVKEQDLSPCVVEGNLQGDNGSYFDRERFSTSCAAFIRSGYPVLIAGLFQPNSGHVNVAVGFRSAYPEAIETGSVAIEDRNINYIYVHDDNIGPNVRFRIEEDQKGRVFLKTEAPVATEDKVENAGSITDGYEPFYPQRLIVAVHNELRTSPDKLHRTGLRVGSDISTLLKALSAHYGWSVSGISLATRFFKLRDYLGAELTRILDADQTLVGKVRLQLAEVVAPMSLHIGVIRIALDDSTTLMDILIDTTDSDANHPIYCHVCYLPIAVHLAAGVGKRLGIEMGVAVTAFVEEES